MGKEMHQISKVWGAEIIFARNELYTGKILVLDKGACSSVHFHKNKDETFYCIQGYALLVVENHAHWLKPGSGEARIRPGERHLFMALDNTRIIEVGTEDKDEDTFRFTESKPGSSGR